MNSKQPVSVNEKSGKWKRYPAYKTSGVEWLGDMPNEWKIRKLKFFSSVKFSTVDKKTEENEKSVLLCNYVDVYKNDFITSDLDFMKATASPNEIALFSLKKGDILITKDSEEWMDIAVPAFVTEDMKNVLCGYHLAQIRPKTDISFGEYLFRSFSARGINDQFRVAANGITRYGIGQYWINNAIFLLPSLPEQITIAAFLNRETARIDTLIAKKKRQIELLQEKRAALISHAVTKGLDPNVKMKDSGIEWIGEVPKHWEISKNKWIYQEIDERSITGEEELLTVSHITGVTPRSEKDVNMFLPLSFEGYKLCKKGDLAINTMWAFMGALGFSPCDGIVSPSYNIYRLEKRYVSIYFDYLYRTPTFICEILRHSKGVWTSRLRLYPEEFLSIVSMIPPVDEQKKIVEHIDSIIEKEKVQIEKIQQSIDLLKEYRTALISAAVTGKIDGRGEV